MNLHHLFLKLKDRKVYIFVFAFIIIALTALIFYGLIDSAIEEENNDLVDVKEPDQEIDKQLELTKKEIEIILQEEPKVKSIPQKKAEKKESAKKKVSKEKIKEEIKRKKSDHRPEDIISELHLGLQKISSGSFEGNDEILKLVNKTYNTEKMLNMIIGDIWKSLSVKKKDEMISVFNEYISKNYIKRFSKIKEPIFEILENKKVGNFLMIKTQLVLNKNEEISISYLLTKKDKEWQIFDVLLANSVSEIATKKSEFNSFLKNGQINSLIEALRKKNTLLLKN